MVNIMIRTVLLVCVDPRRKTRARDTAPHTQDVAEVGDTVGRGPRSRRQASRSLERQDREVTFLPGLGNMI